MGLVQHHPALNHPAKPVCSVCIANYNGASMLSDCIDSVLTQDCNVEVEIIVHDDASTDNSLRVLRDRYPQVAVLASDKNAGFCIANNRMAHYARGSYLLLLNNDASLAPDAISTLLREANKQRPQGILTLAQCDWETGMPVDRGCLIDPFYNPVPNQDQRRHDVAMVIGACLWIPRALWFQLHGFPEWFESIAEDLYLCIRARLAGYPVEITSSSQYRHRQGASFGGNRAGRTGLVTTYRRRRLSERNKTFVLYICTPTIVVWLLLPLHLLVLTLEGLILSAIRTDFHVWREVYAHTWTGLWTHRKLLHAERGRVQATRRISCRQFLECFTLVPRKLVMLWRYGLPRLR